MNPSSFSRRTFLHSLALSGAGTLAFGVEPLTKLPTVNEEIRRAAKAAPLRMAFQGQTPADFAAWRKEFSAELRQRLGRHQPPKSWSVSELSRVEFPDYVREEYLLSADAFPSFPLYVLKPAGNRHGGGPFPIVLALHGHGAFGCSDGVLGLAGIQLGTLCRLFFALALAHQNFGLGRSELCVEIFVIDPGEKIACLHALVELGFDVADAKRFETFSRSFETMLLLDSVSEYENNCHGSIAENTRIG